ncbi:MAG TPA: hypothetical protein VG713_12140, partial [Pirellulales bacterium]|nr:hypothetical protein [Pirellulales bacterium]
MSDVQSKGSLSADTVGMVLHHRTRSTSPVELGAPLSPSAHVVFPRARPLRRAINPAGCANHSIGLGNRGGRCLPIESEFFDWLFAQAGLDARQYRAETLERRLPACLRALRANSTTQARRMLEQNPRLVDTAIGSILIGVTSFFRDADVFDAMGD